MKITKYAAIDIGSNALRLLISNVIEYKKETITLKNSLVRVPIRLGEDAFTTGIISRNNIKQIIDDINPFGVDLSSGVEKELGIKDNQIINNFIEKLNHA